MGFALFDSEPAESSSSEASSESPGTLFSTPVESLFPSTDVSGATGSDCSVVGAESVVVASETSSVELMSASLARA